MASQKKKRICKQCGNGFESITIDGKFWTSRQRVRCFNCLPTDRKKNSYTEEELRAFVPSAFCLSTILRNFGLTASGQNHRILKKKIKDWGIDTSHFLGAGWNKNNFRPTEELIPLEDYLQNKRKIGSHALKLKLIKFGVKENRCEACGLSEVFNPFTKEIVSIPIHLDHIDGNCEDNSLSNLRILCPTCHALTDTYCGKNKMKKTNKTLLTKPLGNDNLE